MQSGLGAKGMFLHIFYWIVLALAAAPLAYYLLSLYCVIGYFHELRKSHPLTSTFAPPASILKPVRGVDHEAYENFASYCRLDYPEYEIIFAVAEPDDPVVPVIERLQADFPDCPIRLVKGVARVGANRKVNSLCRLVHEAKYDLVVMSDSDVRVEPDYLRVATAPLSDSEVGAVTAFYRCRTNGGVAADLDALGMCLDSAPVELGNRIARRGYRVELMRKPVWMVFPRETIRQLVGHELRWSIGLKNVRPTGYRGLILTHGLPWALLAAGVAVGAGWTGVAAAYLLAYVVLRLGLAWITGVWGLGDSGVSKKLWLVPLRDAISFFVWVGGFFSEEIMWRGLAYRVQNGQLYPVPSASLRKESGPRGVGASITSPENIS